MPDRSKLFVATPMYGGMCNGLYTMGMIGFTQLCDQVQLPFMYSYMTNESLITRARNSLAYDFLASDCTHLMFIDADIGFKPIYILNMLACDKDIICGMYPKKELNWPLVYAAVKNGITPERLSQYTGSFVVNLVDDATEAVGSRNQPMQIANGGTGFMLIKRKVFEDLQHKVPTYTHDAHAITDTEQAPKIIDEFFATSIDEKTNRLLSEDYHFCKLARKEGFTVWAAPWVELSHCGTYVFDGRLPSA